MRKKKAGLHEAARLEMRKMEERSGATAAHRGQAGEAEERCSAG